MSPVFSPPKFYHPNGQMMLSVVVLQIAEAVKRKKEDVSACATQRASTKEPDDDWK